ncbi:DNA alkylation repair protein [Aestuariispira insulae]|uniref:3-methyladenine DNA glycosylase AlkC n=1 Tax=Aestuariispira insulae TaxID=1461337 RepID=A0A3D9HMP5_9PROT|nr:DNA alkylation repair protein [Aestuariispira insulae]RED50763.1 3-methyladenine DNA glycosylase AlkC [Aestuariispira insulae]
MPEPFKNFFNPNMVAQMADHFKKQWPDFDRDGFVREAVSGFEGQELKERAHAITHAMIRYLPDDFIHAGKILRASLHPDDGADLSTDGSDADGVRGWGIMCLTEYVAARGQDHFDLSLDLLKEMTKRFSSEFSIRHFLIREPVRTLAVMEDWVKDDNHHVRRLVSEGTRPKLPWAMNLPLFREKPEMVLPLLESLKDDESEYVRRSVANNLNEMAKDHPDLVAELAARWMKGASKNRVRLVKHACRTLVKQGHAGALAALGFGQPEIDLRSFRILTPVVQFGEELRFDIDLASTGQASQNLVIDYAIHHRKANGSLAPKVFKWKNLSLEAGAGERAERKHAIKPITTRKYYPGEHAVEILVNGEAIKRLPFTLVMA